MPAIPTPYYLLDERKLLRNLKIIRQVRETMPDVKVIFISGYAEDTLRPRLDDERTQFLGKPFSLKQLAEKVKETLNPDG